LSGAAQEWLKFVGANLIGAVVNYGVSLLLVHYAPTPFSNKYVAQACGVLAGLVFNFTLSRMMVFKTPPA
jgi:putative flippase GtrA